jgi:hypothetical protein
VLLQITNTTADRYIVNGFSQQRKSLSNSNSKAGCGAELARGTSTSQPSVLPPSAAFKSHCHHDSTFYHLPGRLFVHLLSPTTVLLSSTLPPDHGHHLPRFGDTGYALTVTTVILQSCERRLIPDPHNSTSSSSLERPSMACNAQIIQVMLFWQLLEVHLSS